MFEAFEVTYLRISPLTMFFVAFLQESYVMLEKAIRSLASFYSKAGPSALLPEEIKSEILADLSKADEFL